MAYCSISTRSATPIASAPPEPPSPITMLTIGTLSARHDEQVARDRFALAALFGADAGIRSGCIDQRDERQTELFGELHEPQALAIALGPRHAVVAPDAFLRVTALLMTENDDGLVFEASEAADERVIVGVHAIAVQLLEIREALVDVVERVGPLRVTGELRDLPGRQVRKDAPRERLALVLEARDLLADVELGVLADELQSIDARL